MFPFFPRPEWAFDGSEAPERVANGVRKTPYYVDCYGHRILSEDPNAGQVIAGMRIENPFATPADL